MAISPEDARLVQQNIQRLADALNDVPAEPQMVTTGPDEFVVAPPTAAETLELARQESLNLKLPKAVAVVGCGGVGSWIAVQLALAGVKDLWLFDPDNVSDHNLNRIATTADSVGKSKPEAVASLIKQLRPRCNPKPMGAFNPELANSMKLGYEVEWMVVSTDSLASRQMAYKWTLDNCRYIEAAAEGEFGSITDAPAEWATPEEENPGYASVPVWVGPCMFAATMAVAFIVHDTRVPPDLAIRIGWDGSISYFNSNTIEKVKRKPISSSRAEIDWTPPVRVVGTQTIVGDLNRPLIAEANLNLMCTCGHTLLNHYNYDCRCCVATGEPATRTFVLAPATPTPERTGTNG